MVRPIRTKSVCNTSHSLILLSLNSLAHHYRPQGCEAECCSTSTCAVWQWCPPGAPCYESASNHSCWLGAPSAPASCAAGQAGEKSAGWIGASRVVAPAPTPGPWTGRFMIQVGGDVSTCIYRMCRFRVACVAACGWPLFKLLENIVFALSACLIHIEWQVVD